jgi:BirA family biotin operon repressor/biotin-[acetyl-CoA-carboxylase] ligase
VTPPPSGRRIQHHREVTSTNEVALQGMAEGVLRPGDVVLADSQTAGRGRRGHGWVTVPGRSLAVSVVLPPVPLPRPTRLVLLAAVAACRALASRGVEDVTIKWPNDLMRGERKIGGMLVETARAPDGPEHLVLGWGLNLALEPGDLPPELEDGVGDAGLAPGERDALLDAWLAELDAALDEVGTEADAARGAEFRRRSWLTGRTVRLRASGSEQTVEIADVTPDGDLILADGTGLKGEHVELLPPASGAR